MPLCTLKVDFFRLLPVECKARQAHKNTNKTITGDSFPSPSSWSPHHTFWRKKKLGKSGVCAWWFLPPLFHLLLPWGKERRWRKKKSRPSSLLLSFFLPPQPGLKKMVTVTFQNSLGGRGRRGRRELLHWCCCCCCCRRRRLWGEKGEGGGRKKKRKMISSSFFHKPFFSTTSCDLIFFPLFLFKSWEKH